MPNLYHTLQRNDLSFLKMVANTWGLDLESPDAYTAQSELSHSLLQPDLVAEVIETLPEEARQALQMLVENTGRIPWQHFCRQFGEVRAMGPARRNRERPDINPKSTTEILWYCALIGKAFFDLPPEPIEYAYIPDDLLELLPITANKKNVLLGRPASPVESAFLLPVSTNILDETCTLLAALRTGMNHDLLQNLTWHIPYKILLEFLRCAGILDTHDQPLSNETREFLESPRAHSLALLTKSWIGSNTFNDLRLMPGLVFEGEWQNNPLQIRQKILNMLSDLPQSGWWSLPAFIGSVREQLPDFQRPTGDYDSWFIRKENTSSYLRGFNSWFEVDGALLRFIICGPMHWLGIFDLAAPSLTESPTAFRCSQWAESLWHGRSPENVLKEDDHLRVTANGQIFIPRQASRAARYQIARYSTWEGEKNKEFCYRLTPVTMEKAREKGLKLSQVLGLLRRHSARSLPPKLVEALEQWDRLGTQARMETHILLRVNAPEVINALRKTYAARYLGELITPTIISVKKGAEEKVRDALIEIGCFTSRLDD